MKSKAYRTGIWPRALLIAAVALCGPVAAQAQTSTSSTSTVPATDVQTAPAEPAPATVDQSAAIDVGVGSGPTNIASDSSGNLWVTLQFTGKVMKLGVTGAVLGTYNAGRNPTGIAARRRCCWPGRPSGWRTNEATP
jgi:streptogramin lyase